MPPLQDSCISARGARPAPPTTSGRVDGTAAILAQFYEMSIREDYGVEDKSAKGTASQDRALDCSSEDKDVVASITSLVQSISLASSTAVRDAEEAAASHVGSLDAEHVASSNDLDVKSTVSSKDIEDAKSTASSKDIEDVKSTASSKNIEVVKSTAHSKDVEDAKSTASSKNIGDVKSTAHSKDVEDTKSTASIKNIEDVKSTAHSKDVEDAKSTASSKNIEDVRSTVSSKDIKNVKSTAHSKDVEDAKSTASSKNIEDVKSTVSSKDIKDAKSTVSTNRVTSKEKEGKIYEKEVTKKNKMISRGLMDNTTQVYSSDRQAGGLVFTYDRTPVLSTFDTPQALPAQQWFTNYREPQQLYSEVSNVDSSSSGNLQLDMLSGFPLEEASGLTVLPGDEVEQFLEGLNKSEEMQSAETDDEGLPPSPESFCSVSSPSYSNHSSATSGRGSPCGSISMMSSDCNSLPPSPAQVYVPSMSPPHHKPIRPKARPAREIILERISKDEKQEACLKINLASEEKLMRSSDPDGDTNLTVLVRFWEQHKRPMALLYAIVERMKFIKNGLSKKTLKGENALRLAAMFAHTDPLVARYIAEVMVEYGEDINEVDGNGNTVIHSLCWMGDTHIHVLEDLLSINKFDVNHANHYGVTPLSYACSKGAVQMVAMLLASGAQLNQCGASSRGEPLALLTPDQLQEVERLYKELASRKYTH